MPDNRSVIVGLGKSSSQFTEKLVRALVSGPKGHGLVAVGIYDNGPAGPEVRKSIRRRTRRLHVDDISVKPTPTQQSARPELADLVSLRRRVVEYEPQLLLVIFDAALMRYGDVPQLFFADLRAVARQVAIIAVCFTDDTQGPDPQPNSPADYERRAYASLAQHTQPDVANNRPPALEAAFIIRTNSPLKSAVGSENMQDKLLAQSLAGIWSAPLHWRENADIERQVTRVRQPTKKFIGIAAASVGLTMKKPAGLLGRLLYPILSRTTWGITAEGATEAITALTYQVLESNPVAMTTVEPYPYLGPTAPPPDIHEVPISVNLIVPFRASDGKFEKVRTLVERALASPRPRPDLLDPAGQPDRTSGRPPSERRYTVNLLSSVRGKGVKHLGSPPGRFYCQVCVLFAIDRDQISAATAVHSPARREQRSQEG